MLMRTIRLSISLLLSLLICLPIPAQAPAPPQPQAPLVRPDPKRAQKAAERGDKAEAAGRFDEALAAYEEAARYAPQDADVIERGVALRSKLVRAHVGAAERDALAGRVIDLARGGRQRVLDERHRADRRLAQLTRRGRTFCVGRGMAQHAVAMMVDPHQLANHRFGRAVLGLHSGVANGAAPAVAAALFAAAELGFWSLERGAARYERPALVRRLLGIAGGAVATGLVGSLVLAAASGGSGGVGLEAVGVAAAALTLAAIAFLASRSSV